MPVVRTEGRAVGRSVYGHVITNVSRMGSLPHFFTHGAPLRALRARELRYNGLKEKVPNQASSNIQLFRERLSEQMWTRQPRKVIWDMINTLFPNAVAVEPTFVAFL